MTSEQLEGPVVVVARSKEGNEELIAELRGLGVTPVGIETIEFLPPDDWKEVDGAIGRISGFDWMVFTSPRGVDFFVSRLRVSGETAVGTMPRVAAVGPSTAGRLAKNGFAVEYVPDHHLTSALADGLPSGLGKRVLLLRTDIADREMASKLRGRGFEVEDVAVYRSAGIREAINPRRVEKAELILFASASEVRGFSERLGSSALARLQASATAVCIGPVTARAAAHAGFRRVVTSREQSIGSLVEVVRRFGLHA
jgi:uroporphyrinogen-III synthase